ncbi:MAG: efflux RND transporter periplasmic adaptor subunit, partial [Planctomycetota bacterium]
DNVKNHSLISGRKGLFGALIIVVLIGAGIVWLTGFWGGKAAEQDVPTFTVKRGPLTISVVESGTIKARDQHIVKSEVEGRPSIITLVPEGTRVKEGDLLIELDASSLQDGKIDQEISVLNAEAAHINAQENLAIVTSQVASDVNQAELDLEFARQDLKKYEEGQYPKDVNEANKRITLAKEELERSEQTLEWSNRLHEEKYLSETERAADEITVKRRRLEYDLAVADLNLLQDFTYPRQIRQFQSDVQQAVSALDRAKRKADADKRQAEADLKAKEAEYTRQQAKLLKIEDQLMKTTILAPCDGLVVHASSTKSGLASMLKEPLAEGQQVHERQELIYLPKDASTMAEVSIHETSLAKVQIGQPAVVTVETLPGKKFRGTVALVAPLPDSAGMFLNPDLKIFKTQINLDTDDPALRTGMTCRAEIIVEQYDDAVYVPIQAVTRIGGDTLVYVSRGGSVVPRRVEIGLDNNRMIRIISGLKEGEVVLLDPPLKPSSVDEVPTSDPEPNKVSPKLDAIDQQVRDRLDASWESGLEGTAPAPTGAGPQGAPPMQAQGIPTLTQERMPQGAPSLSPRQHERTKKQMQKAMDLMKNMSEQEKERVRSMSMEERMRFFRERMEGDRQK